MGKKPRINLSQKIPKEICFLIICKKMSIHKKALFQVVRSFFIKGFLEFFLQRFAAAHGADVFRKYFLVPLDPFVVIDVVPFTLSERPAMNDPTPSSHFDRNDDVQALVINDSCHCVERAVRGIVTPADANQVEILAR